MAAMRATDEEARAYGSNVRELRMAAGYGSKEFAALLGWPADRLSKIETGKQAMTVTDMNDIAGALRKTPRFQAISKDDLKLAINGDRQMEVSFRPTPPRGGISSDPPDSAMGGNVTPRPRLVSLSAAA